MRTAFENIDRLQCMELQGTALPYGMKAGLYDLAREVAGRPLVEAAAELLDRPAARVAIVTGAAVPGHMPVGENDGPLGSSVLAGVLIRIGHRVAVYTDPPAAPPLAALFRRAGLDVPVVELALHDPDQQRKIAESIDMAIAVERTGGNVNGRLYGATGVARDAFRSNVDHLFRAAAELGKSTLGIGDGGNEIGFGRIHRRLVEHMPDLNRTDRTPCGGGVFSTVATDALVVATTSNLGCYGVVAALAVRRREADLCHTPEEELALIEFGSGLGLVDGDSGTPIAAVDGVDAEDHAAVVRLMRAIVRRALAAPVERAF